VSSFRLAVLMLLVFAAPASADSVTARSGAVTATFTFDRVDRLRIENPRLQIARAGAVAYDAPLQLDGCEPDYCMLGGDKPVRARDLDGDRDPEVLVDIYTGGAHCCYVTGIFSWDGSAYRQRDRNWADPGYRLRNPDGRGTPELVTADPRFGYAFSAYGFSGMPVKILRFRKGKLVNVTRKFRRVVRKDARRWKRAFRARDNYEPQGALAAWAADKYLLGRRKQARRFVRHAVRHGRLRGKPRARSFPRRLHRTLKRWGY
jgi:hypothetical protein